MANVMPDLFPVGAAYHRVEGEDAIGNAPVANAGAQGHYGEARVCFERRQDGAPTIDDRCFSSLLAVGHIEDRRAQSLSVTVVGSCAPIFPICQA